MGSKLHKKIKKYCTKTFIKLFNTWYFCNITTVEMHISSNNFKNAKKKKLVKKKSLYTVKLSLNLFHVLYINPSKYFFKI